MLPSTSKVIESTVIKAPIESTWAVIRDLDLSFWSVVESSTLQGTSPLEIGSSRKIKFKDGTVQTVRIVEISELNRSISYELVESVPPVPFMSSVNVITVKKVTSDNTCFIEWETYFSSDGGVEATEDSRFKKREALADLAALLENSN
ncbi:hypothetical protein BB559_001565 [Furculomyces boomerangus]|uniref:Bet v I/Major latex protein domain-containing protein n=2 Tax=Harpellales TaxID=61421 RepID=A0A2T9Z1F4_9FUNG|nr:hypothetical protein BB559_006823 [Furculomyces boomerangus]PVU98422.1 hypothetical protein BB559_001565 [Furculomyces boomerangus]PWA01049.1 hypothetical protein BB558_002845 [Smittium angustum]